MAINCLDGQKFDTWLKFIGQYKKGFKPFNLGRAS